VTVASRRRRLAFIVAAIALSVGATFLTLLAADVYARHKYPLVNRHGYTGPIAGSKQPGEYRVVVLGGSTVFGYGYSPDWTKAFPAHLERALGSGFRVINLGFNNTGAYSMWRALQQYGYLEPDLAVLYEGYNNLNGENLFDMRERSFVFRWTGYYPMLPIIISEKAKALRYGDARSGYLGKVMFKPSLARRSGAAALEAVEQISKALDRVGMPTATTKPVDDRIATYCRQMATAIEEAQRQHIDVIVAGQPRLNDWHRQQQAALQAVLRERFPSVVYVDLAHTVDLTDRSLAWDGMHLTDEGNERIAQALVPIVRRRRLAAGH
jgi:lysophospholipase L1-like esterase